MKSWANGLGPIDMQHSAQLDVEDILFIEPKGNETRNFNVFNDFQLIFGECRVSTILNFP